MKKVALLFALLSVWSLHAHAFDGQRSGFMMNLGAGMGQAKLTAEAMGFEVSNDEIGFGTDFRLGGGISENTLIYYFNRTIFYSVDDYSFVNGMSGAGVSYFFDTYAPGFYVSGGLGMGVWMDLEESESESGWGFMIGGGYEFAPNFTIEASYLSAKVAEEDGVDLSISNIQVFVSWLAY